MISRLCWPSCLGVIFNLRFLPLSPLPLPDLFRTFLQMPRDAQFVDALTAGGDASSPLSALVPNVVHFVGLGGVGKAK